MLTNRQWRGYLLEELSGKKLESAGLVKDVSLFCNPSDPDEWIRNIGRGADIRLIIGTTLVSVECKSNNAPIYESYVERDYIPRFIEDVDVGLRFILTDNILWYTPAIVKLLLDHHIVVITLPTLLRLVKRLLSLPSITNRVGYGGSVYCYYEGVGVFNVGYDALGDVADVGLHQTLRYNLDGTKGIATKQSTTCSLATLLAAPHRIC